MPSLSILPSIIAESILSSARDGRFSEPSASSLAELFTALGENESPKILPAVLHASTGRMALGLFTQRQAKHPGRTMDFGGLLRVGGLVVDASKAPECGVVEFVSGRIDVRLPDTADPTVAQILRTDGNLWQAWVRDDVDYWRLRETFPGQGRESFLEFLRRALLNWQKRHQPDVLARYLASHAREWVEYILCGQTERLGAFRQDLENSLGLVFGESSMAARVQVAAAVLEQVRRRLGEDFHTADLPENFEHWLSESPQLPEYILESLPRLFEENPHHATWSPTTITWRDRQAVAFGTEFWRELIRPARCLEGFSEERREAAKQQVGEWLPALSAANHIRDPNAGQGDYILAWLIQNPDTDNCRVEAYEAHPLGFQLLRFRLVAAFMGRRGPDTHAGLMNVFRGHVPPGEAALIGEARPHLSTDMSLALPGGQYVSHGWGAKLINGDFATEAYLHTVRATIGRSNAATLRLPATWAEEDEQQETRAALLAGLDDLYIDAKQLAPRPKDRRMSRGDVSVLIHPHGRAPDHYRRVAPRAETRYSLLAPATTSEYLSWPSLSDLALRKPFNGPIERRGMTLIDIDRERLEQRLRDYFSDMSDAELEERHESMMRNRPRFDAKAVRKTLKKNTNFLPSRLQQYSFRPFDDRWIYTHDLRPLFSEPANELFALSEGENFFLVASEGHSKPLDGPLAWWGRYPCDYDFLVGHSGHFPVWTTEQRLPRRRRAGAPAITEIPSEDRVANLSNEARDYLERLGYPDPDESRESALVLWLHALAVLYTPAYQEENRDAMRHGWPRIPLPGYHEKRPSHEVRMQLERSAALGKRIAELLGGSVHDESGTDSPSHFMAMLKVDSQTISPEVAAKNGQLSVNANWCAPRGKEDRERNIIRPRPGKTQYHPAMPFEYDLFKQQDVEPRQIPNLLGNHFVDVYLNDSAYWSNIPENAWNYAIGGRQVLSKWLSYREESRLERPLTPKECRHFADTVNRILSLLLLSLPLSTHNGLMVL